MSPGPAGLLGPALIDSAEVSRRKSATRPFGMHMWQMVLITSSRRLHICVGGRMVDTMLCIFHLVRSLPSEWRQGYDCGRSELRLNNFPPLTIVLVWTYGETTTRKSIGFNFRLSDTSLVNTVSGFVLLKFLRLHLTQETKSCAMKNEIPMTTIILISKLLSKLVG